MTLPKTKTQEQREAIFRAETGHYKEFHLFLTGPFEGEAFCKTSRMDVNLAEVKFYHALYAPEALLSDERLCPHCRHYWMEDTNYEAGEKE